eukprot:1467085-Pyramimonas_sp.AAC.1
MFLLRDRGIEPRGKRETRRKSEPRAGRHDSRGTGAVHGKDSLIASLLATGMLDTFGIHHPTMQAVSRCGPGGTGKR